MKNLEDDFFPDDLKMDGFGEKEPETLPESFENATKEEISEVLKAFKQRAKEEAEQKAANISTEYWFAVYFASENQRNLFLSAYKLLQKMEDQYISADDFCNALGYPLEKEEINTPKAFRKPAGIDDLIMDF